MVTKKASTKTAATVENIGWLFTKAQEFIKQIDELRYKVRNINDKLSKLREHLEVDLDKVSDLESLLTDYV